MKVFDKSRFKSYYCENRHSVSFACFFLVIAYGIKIFQIMFSHDTEAIISVPESLYNSWMTMGRYGLIFLKKLLGIYTFNPYLAAILMFFSMVGAVVVWGYLFYILKEETNMYSKVSWIFPAVFLTTPMMAEQMGFLLQAFEVCFAVLLLGIVLLMVWNSIFTGKYFWLLPSVLISALIFSVYQTMVPLFVAGAAASFLTAYRRQKKTWWTAVLLLAGVFGFGFALYEVVNKLIMKALGIATTPYISDQMLWGTVPVSQCVTNIFQHVCQVITGQGFYYSLSFPAAIVMAALLVIWQGQKKKGEFYLYVIAAVVFLLTPFLMTVLMGQAPKMRTQLILGFVTGWYLQNGIECFWLNRKKMMRGAAYAGVCLTAVLCFSQAAKVADMYYTEYVQYQEDVALALKISARIDQLDLGECPQEPVVFVGARTPRLNDSAVRNLENLGHSFFEWSFTTDYGSFIMRNFMESLGYAYRAPNSQQVEIAQQAAGNMGIWPASDSVQVIEDVIVVRLS